MHKGGMEFPMSNKFCMNSSIYSFVCLSVFDIVIFFSTSYSYENYSICHVFLPSLYYEDMVEDMLKKMESFMSHRVWRLLLFIFLGFWSYFGSSVLHFVCSSIPLSVWLALSPSVSLVLFCLLLFLCPYILPSYKSHKISTRHVNASRQ